MFETMFAYIKECERKIGNNARVGISIHTNQVVLMVRWGNDKLSIPISYGRNFGDISRSFSIRLVHCQGEGRI